MNLGLRDAARLFTVSESTVVRWVKEEGLAAFLINGQYRFNRVDLLEWAGRRKLPLAPQQTSLAGGSEPVPSLAEVLEEGGIHHRVPGADVKAVMASVAALLPLPPADRALAAQVLTEREGRGSTSVGEGIAIPHPRSPMVFPVERPLALLGFLEQPVDFKATDGIPVRVLFVLIAPTVKSHLALLSRIAGALHVPAFREALLRQASREEILARLREIQ